MNGRALVAWNLRRIRSQKGVSQERLADEAGVDRTYVGTLEREEASASVDILDRLADALGVELSALFVTPTANEERPLPMKAGRRPKA